MKKDKLTVIEFILLSLFSLAPILTFVYLVLFGYPF